MQLPATIEAFLFECGFSATEMLVLARLMGGEALSLRELALRTGKGIGALDKAVKKLMRRKMVKRELINGRPKYTVESLSAIQKWMKKESSEKMRNLERREFDFESFLSSLHRELCRPEIEHYEGAESMQEAYERIISLSRADKKILHYLPSACLDREGCLKELRLEYDKRRLQEKISENTIACDTPAGRRLKSRDLFERRETVLVSEGDFPITIEKFLTSDCVAYIDPAELKSTIIHYRELAQEEQMTFHAICVNVGRIGMSREQCAARAPKRFRVNAWRYFLMFRGIPLLACFVILVLVLGMR